MERFISMVFPTPRPPVRRTIITMSGIRQRRVGKDKFEANWDHYKAHNFKMEHDFLVKLHTVNIIEKQLVPSKTVLRKTVLHTPL